MSAQNLAIPSDKTRVLVVDDSRVMRKAITKILKDDASIIEAEDGEEGWGKILQNEDIQVLITDIEMPVLDGYQLICRIRAYDENRIRNLPIITITGAEDEETKARAFACGATDFIVKPLDKMQLQARVQAHAKMDETSRQLEQTTATLEEEATTDPLTGLSSRRYFMQRCAQDIAHAKRHGTGLSLMRVDIDGFKKLYQQHGDEVADQMLVFVAQALVAAARTEDTVSRVGGAEFAVITPATGKTEATVLAERLCRTVEEKSFRPGNSTDILTVSIGVVTLAADVGESIEELFDLADKRLRNAKAEGGNCVSASTRSETANETEELTLAAPVLNNDEAEFKNDSANDDEEFMFDAAEQDVAVDIKPKAETTLKPTVAPELPVELININQVLDLLAKGESNRITPYALDLCLRILPLLEYCNREHHLGLENAIDSIKEKMYSMK